MFIKRLCVCHQNWACKKATRTKRALPTEREREEEEERGREMKSKQWRGIWEVHKSK